MNNVTTGRKYCEKCGKELVMVTKGATQYDDKTGREYRVGALQCPDYGWFSRHTRIEGVADGNKFIEYWG